MTLIVQNAVDPGLYNTLATLTGSQTMVSKTLKIVKEPVTFMNAAPASNANFDVVTQSISVYNTATTNFILNIRGDASTTLNSLVGVGESIGISIFVPNGATAYYLSNVSIDGDTSYANRTIKYQGGAAFTSGSTNATDVYVVFLIKTANSAWNVYISQTKYA
jgi:hypothetical protein